MSITPDQQLLSTLVQNKILSPDQAKESVTIYQQALRSGNNVTLLALLVQQDYISRELATQISQQYMPKSNSAVSVGNMFAHYKIINELGRGGMGIVYKAVDTKLNRVVALKVLLKDDVSEKQLKRFILEAQATANLNHPNIINLYEVGSQPKHYFTMEYIEGKTLSDHIKNKSLNSREIAAIIEKCAQALHLAHKNKIIHRDIKPSNIMMHNGEPKVMDFGLAKEVNYDRGLSQEGGMMGTPAYMPPEQADGSNVTAQSDVYSLGATLYHMLTGRRVFEGDTHFRILSQIFNQDPIPLRSLNPDTPKDLEAICLKCLEKKPGKRYGSANILANDLQSFLNHRAIRAKPAGVRTHIQKWIIRNKLVSALGLLVVIAVLTTILTLFFMLEAAKENEQKLAKSIKIEKEANKKAQIAKNVMEKANVKVLHYAVVINNLDIVKVCLEKGVDVNIQANNGNTPLLTAALYGYIEIIDLLLSKGAKIDLKNNEGLTPVLGAARYSNLNILKRLLKKGANINDVDKQGRNILAIAILGSPVKTRRVPEDAYIQTVQWLLPKFAIDAKSKEGKTALVYATEVDHAEIVKLLLSKGASPHIKVGEETVVDFVKTSSVAKVFKKHGVEIPYCSPWDLVIKHSEKSSSKTLKNFVQFAKLVPSINKTEIETRVSFGRGRYKRTYKARIPVDSTQTLRNTFKRESLFAFDHLSRDTEDFVKAALKKYKDVKLEYEFEYAGAKSNSLKIDIDKGSPWEVSFKTGRSGRKVKLSIPNVESMEISGWVSPWQTILIFLEAIESKDKTKLAKIADSKITANAPVSVLKLFATLEKQKAHFDKIVMKVKLPEECKKEVRLGIIRTKDQDAYKHLHEFAIKSLKELFQQDDKWLMDYVKKDLSLEYSFYYATTDKKVHANIVLTWTGTHWIVASYAQK